MRYVQALVLLFLIPLPSYSTLPSTAEWEVRTTGADTNGGFFSSARSGTDYSQQDAAQIAVTDAVTDGTATITSATANFPTNLPGNGCYTAGGTGSITAAWYEVVTRNSSTSITVDRSTGLTAGTGVTLNCGGALATIQKGLDKMVQENTVWIKATTWTITTTLTTLDGNGEFKIRGYNSTHGDRSTKPLITTATNSTTIFTVTPTTSGIYRFDNLSLSNTATTRDVGIKAVSSYATINVSDMVFDGFTHGILADGSTVGHSLGVGIVSSEFKNCSLSAATITYTGMNTHGNYLHDLTKDGFVGSLTNQSSSHVFNIFANIGRYAVYHPNGSASIGVSNNTFYTVGTTFTGNPFPNIAVGNSIRAATVVNNVFYGGSGASSNHYLGSDGCSADCIGEVVARNNAYDSVGIGPAPRYIAIGDQSLTADPFTNAASGDFKPNSTAGGGVLLKSNAFPGTFPGGTSIGSFDIGAVQTGSSGGGQRVYTSVN